MVEAGTGGAPTVDVDLGDLGEARDALHHDGKCVVVVPSEEVHAARLHLRGDGRDYVEVGFVGRAEVLERGVAEVLRIVVVEGSAGAKLAGAVFAVIRKWYWSALRGPVRIVVVGVNENGIDATLFLKSVEQLIYT